MSSTTSSVVPSRPSSFIDRRRWLVGTDPKAFFLRSSQAMESVLQAGLEKESMLKTSLKRKKPLLGMADGFHIYGPGCNSHCYACSIIFLDDILKTDWPPVAQILFVPSILISQYRCASFPALRYLFGPFCRGSVSVPATLLWGLVLSSSGKSAYLDLVLTWLQPSELEDDFIFSKQGV